MTELITEEQRKQATEAMKMFSSLCPNKYIAYRCDKSCQFKEKHLCPAELSIYIQHFLESIPDQLAINIEKLVKDHRKDYAKMLTEEDGIIISDKEAVNEWLFHHTGAYQEILMAVSMIKREFGKEVELELRIEPHRNDEVSARLAIITLRLPVYENTQIIDRLDEISEALDDGKEDSDVWLLLTTDFRIIGGNTS